MTQDERKALHQQWREHVQAWQQSGLTQVVFCRQAGISKHQLSYWRKLFADPAPRSRLIPLSPARPVAHNPACIRAFLPGGIRLDIPADIAAVVLPSLLAAQVTDR